MSELSAMPSIHELPPGWTKDKPGLAEFKWLPAYPFSFNEVLIQRVHEKIGWRPIWDCFKDPETLLFICTSPGLSAMHKAALGMWRPSKTLQGLSEVVSVLLTMQELIFDFAGCGKLYPEAKRKAEAVGAGRLGRRLLDFYCSAILKGGTDTLARFENEIRVSFAQRKAAAEAQQAYRS
jgi:hypothetical protein